VVFKINLVAKCFQVLSSYINPGDLMSSTESNNMSYRDSMSENCDLPPLFMELLQQSCLIPALCSYLRNDSGNFIDITN
jgi:baculoviral IAP repeat-containing protein 6